MSRKIARESVYKLVFEYLFLQKVNRRTYDILSSIELSEVDRKYMFTAYTGIINNYSKLITMIDELSEGFSLDRIFKPDLAALLVAVYEMNHMADIPHSVSISEAVELVKKYSTEKSNQYVNGVLSSVYKKINNISDVNNTKDISTPEFKEEKNDKINKGGVQIGNGCCSQVEVSDATMGDVQNLNNNINAEVDIISSTEEDILTENKNEENKE